MLFTKLLLEVLYVQIEQDFLYPVGRTSKYLFKYKMFCLQSNVIATRLRQRSLHSTQNLKRYFEARIFSPIQMQCHRPATKFSGRPTPAAQFIDTHLHVASRNLDYQRSLFFPGPLHKTSETRKWPRAWLKARDGRGTATRFPFSKQEITLNIQFYTLTYYCMRLPIPMFHLLVSEIPANKTKTV